MASLNKAQIEDAMAKAGLQSPRVILHMTADRKAEFHLYAGTRESRRKVIVPKTNNDAAVREAIAQWGQES